MTKQVKETSKSTKTAKATTKTTARTAGGTSKSSKATKTTAKSVSKMCSLSKSELFEYASAGLVFIWSSIMLIWGLAINTVLPSGNRDLYVESMTFCALAVLFFCVVVVSLVAALSHVRAIRVGLSFSAFALLLILSFVAGTTKVYYERESFHLPIVCIKAPCPDSGYTVKSAKNYFGLDI